MDLVATASRRHAPRRPCVSATCEGHPGELVLGPRQERIRPDGRGRRATVGAVDGVVVEAMLEADLARVLEADLPVAGVAREERDVTAARDEALDGVAHACTPVLVVPDTHVQSIGREQIRIAVEIEARGDVDAIAGGFGPAEEPSLPRRPARHAVP